MPVDKKQKARLLRSQGHSIGEIEKKLKVARSSISYWVKDIKLSSTLKKALNERARIKNLETLNKIASNRKHRHLKIREKYQKKGRDLLKGCDNKFIAGLMLYWAEGWKNRNSVVIANSDPELMKLFIDFLRIYFKPDERRIKLKIRWFSDNGLTFDEIKEFWLNKLNLTEESLNQCDADIHGSTNKCKKTGKLPYGIAVIALTDTSVLQKILGAIQGFVGFTNKSWIL